MPNKPQVLAIAGTCCIVVCVCSLRSHNAIRSACMVGCVLATLAHAMRGGRLAVRLRRAVWFVRAPVASSGARRRYAAHPVAPLVWGVGAGLVSVGAPAGWLRVAGRHPLATLGVHNPRPVWSMRLNAVRSSSTRYARCGRHSVDGLLHHLPCGSMQFALPTLATLVAGDTP